MAKPAASAQHKVARQQQPQGCTSAGGSSRQPAALTLRALLLGFPRPATEAAYLGFTNRRCLAGVDRLAAAVSLMVMATVFLSMASKGVRQQDFFPAAAGAVTAGTSAVTAATADSNGSSTAAQGDDLTVAQVNGVLEALLLNAPWAVLLANRRWYLQHREVLLLVLGGAGRVLSSLTHGLLTVVTGHDQCSHVPNCGCVMLLACALHYPATQQLRLKPAAVLTLVDVTGVVLYGSFTWGSLWRGVGAGVLAGAAGLAVTAGLEFRSRSAFLASWRGMQ